MTNKLKKFKDWSINEKTVIKIEGILDSCVDGSWKLKDGMIYIDGSFDASNKKLGDLKDLDDFNFGEVTGDFDVSINSLVSLSGCPKIVGGSFNCSSNLLKSLEFSPEKSSNFYCSNNFIFSLKGISNDSDDYVVSGNNLESLEGLPEKIAGNLIAGENPNLTSLEGSPKYVGGNFDVSSCSLGSLEYGPIEVGKNYLCSDNNLKDLNGAPEEIGGYFDASHNQIKSIKGLPKNIKWGDLSNNKVISLEGMSKEAASKKFFIGNNSTKGILKVQQNYILDNGDLEGWVEHTLSKNPSLIFSPLNFQKNSDITEEAIKLLELEKISKENPKLLSYLASNLHQLPVFKQYVDKFKDSFSEEFLEDAKISSDLKDLGF